MDINHSDPSQSSADDNNEGEDDDNDMPSLWQVKRPCCLPERLENQCKAQKAGGIRRPHLKSDIKD